jgi:hypothetical protein
MGWSKVMQSWIGRCTWVALGLLLAAGAGCERTTRGPVVVVAALGQDEVHALLGKEGGSLSFPGGGAMLEIPAGLLLEDVHIFFKREPPTFDLTGKDFLGEAYRVSPHLSFAPGAAKLSVPVDKELPGSAEDVKLRVYSWDKYTEEGPEGTSTHENWIPQPLAKFAGFSQDRKHAQFWIYETISARTTKGPVGLFQAGFDSK